MTLDQIRKLVASYPDALSYAVDCDGVAWVWGEPIHLDPGPASKACLDMFGLPEELGGYRVYRAGVDC